MKISKMLKMASGKSVIILMALMPFAVLPSSSAEKLANPFGGMPPEFGPPGDDAVSWKVISSKNEFNFTLYYLNKSGRIKETSALYSIKSKADVKRHCVGEAGYSFTANGFNILASEYGCWKEKDNPDKYKYTDQWINLGGFNLGSYNCQYSNSRKTVVSCLYTPSIRGQIQTIEMIKEI